MREHPYESTQGYNQFGDTLEDAFKRMNEVDRSRRRYFKKRNAETNRIRESLGQPSIEEQEAKTKEMLESGRYKYDAYGSLQRDLDTINNVTFGKEAELNIKRMNEERKRRFLELLDMSRGSK